MRQANSGTVCRTLKDAREDDAILCVCRQDLKSLLTLELGNLGWSHTKGRPTRPPKPNAFIAARLVHEYKLPGTEIRDIMQV
jgi:hypothetical protein